MEKAERAMMEPVRNVDFRKNKNGVFEKHSSISASNGHDFFSKRDSF